MDSNNATMRVLDPTITLSRPSLAFNGARFQTHVPTLRTHPTYPGSMQSYRRVGCPGLCPINQTFASHLQIQLLLPAVIAVGDARSTLKWSQWKVPMCHWEVPFGRYPRGQVEGVGGGGGRCRCANWEVPIKCRYKFRVSVEHGTIFV